MHQAAGAERVVELHGNIHANHCFNCEAHFTGDVIDCDEPPLCPECGGLVRPSVVWFGETLPMHAWIAAEKATISCDVFLSIGTASVVYPAAGLIELAKEHGAMVIEINPNPTRSPFVDVFISQQAGECLPKLLGKHKEI